MVQLVQYIKILMLKFGKNIAGKERLVLTITGSIIVLVVAWITGTLFMPKRDFGKDMHDKAEIWINKSDNGFTRMEIKEVDIFIMTRCCIKENQNFTKAL